MKRKTRGQRSRSDSAPPKPVRGSRTDQRVRATAFRASRGGAAGIKGSEYEMGLAALVCVHILAQEPLEDVVPEAIPESVFLQSGAHVDDVEVRCRGGGAIHFQSKYELTFRGGASPMAGAIDQMVREFRRWQTSPFAPLQLVVAHAKASGLAAHLASIAERFRQTTPNRAQVLRTLSRVERECLTKLEALIRHSWGRGCRWQDVGAILAQSHFWQVPVGAHGRIVIDRHGLLRHHVLQRTEDATKAASYLTTNAIRLARSQGGTDLNGLRAGLRTEVRLREPPDLRDDVQQLAIASGEHLARLERSGQLSPNVRISMRRPIVTDLAKALRIRGPGLLLVGEPGAGKSTALAQLAKKLRRRAQVVLLRTADLPGSDLVTIEQGLRLSHSLSDVLSGMPDPLPAYLLIDGLDTERDNAARGNAVRTLIEAALHQPDRWRVVATVRRYDLIHAHHWRELFRGEPVGDAATTELVHVAHVWLGEFSDADLAKLRKKVPALDLALASGDPRVHKLLRNPFNLRLFLEVLDATRTPPPVLGGRRELLRAYWNARVRQESDPPDRRRDPEAREMLLRRLATQVIQTREPERPIKEELTGAGATSTLDDLCRDGILVKSRDQTHVAFAQDLIFEYALARHFMTNEAAAFDYLMGDPGAALNYYESLSLWLESLWQHARTTFWAYALRALAGDAAGPRAPGIARILVADVILANAKSAADLHPLRAHRDPDQRALRFACEYAAADPTAIALDAWLTFIEGIAPSCTAIEGTLASRLLTRILEKRTDLSAEERRQVSQCARALIEASWLATEAQSFSAYWAQHALVLTFDADFAANEGLLLRLFAPSSTAPHRDDEIAELTHDLDRIPSPRLMDAAYRHVLRRAIEDESARLLELGRWHRDATSATENGQPVPPAPQPNRNRVGGHDEGYWLKTHAAAFLARDRVAFVRMVADAVREWDALLRPGQPEPTPAVITLRGREMRVRAIPADRIRTHTIHVIEDLIAIVGVTVSTSPEPARGQLLDALIEREAPLSIWAQIVDAAVKTHSLRAEVAPLLGQPLALKLLYMPLARLIAAWRRDMPADVASHLEAALAELGPGVERARIVIEKAFASTSGTSPPPPSASLITPDAEDDDDEFVPAIEYTTEEFDLTHLLHIPQEILRLPQNVRIRDLTREAMRLHVELAGARRDPLSDGELADAAHAKLLELRRVIDDAAVDPTLRTRAWSALSTAASDCVRLGDRRLALVVMEASRSREALPWATGSSGTDLLNRGPAFPRAEAVPGLIALARGGDTDAIDRLDRLARDDEPSVRYRIAWDLNLLADLPPQICWPIAERLVADEHLHVAGTAIAHFHPFYGLDRQRGIRIAHDAYYRMQQVTDDPPPQQGLTAALGQLAFYELTTGDETAKSVSNHAIASLETNGPALQQVMHSYRPWLTIAGGAGDQEVRQRTVDLFRRIALGAVLALQHDIAEGSAPNAPQRSERPRSAQLLEAVALQLSFAIDAENDETVPATSALRLYSEAGRLLVEIGTAGVVSASEKILEILDRILELLSRVADGVVNVAEPLVLRQFLEITLSALSNGWGSQYWMLDAVERTLRRCIAERDEALSDSATVETINAIVNRLLDYGWPQAYLLARDLGLSR